MKRARDGFTLLELLVVIAIMAILGSVAMGGFRAMELGVTERAAVRAMNQFIRAAYHRAQIEKVPVSVFYWNETLREETSLEPPIVVGKAVAVRRSGRATYVSEDGLYDEFGDLQYSSSSYGSPDGKGSEESSMWIYKLNGNEGNSARRSRVLRDSVRGKLPLSGTGDGHYIDSYYYPFVDRNGVTWQIGDAYGMEFLDITLPRNFLIGENYSKSTSDPVKGEGIMRFVPGANSGNGPESGVTGESTVKIFSLRPNSKGAPATFAAGETVKPDTKMDKR